MCPGYSFLHLQIHIPNNSPASFHLLTVFADHPDKLPDPLAIGCTAIHIDRRFSNSAFLSKNTLRIFNPYDDNPPLHPNIQAIDNKIVLIDNNTTIEIGPLNEVLFAWGASLAVLPSYRRQGWGTFLIQTAAQIALSYGLSDFKFQKLEHDGTRSLSSKGVSLYSQALGSEFLTVSPELASIPIGSYTPSNAIDRISKSFLSGIPLSFFSGKSF